MTSSEIHFLLSVNGEDHNIDIYKTTIETLEAAGYFEGIDLFVFPYDWRKNIEDTLTNEGTVEGIATQLLAKIDEVRTQTGADRVDILAHSLGGIVTRTALARPESIGKVRRVVTLGSPVLGATKALGALEYQTPCFIEVSKFCLSNPSTLQEVITNLPSTYQILPGPAFDDAEDPPLVIDRDTNGDGQNEGPQPYEMWSEIVSSHRNEELMLLNFEYHDVDALYLP